jgi:Zn-finger in ubiquitin-hydrolases and other protein
MGEDPVIENGTSAENREGSANEPTTKVPVDTISLVKSLEDGADYTSHSLSAAIGSDAAATVAGSNDENIARQMHVLEQLTVIYAFPSDVANRAMEAVATQELLSIMGLDEVIAMCCTYILDNNLAADQGGSVVPIDNCPHVLSHLQQLITVNDLPILPQHVLCSYEYSNGSTETGNDDDLYEDVQVGPDGQVPKKRKKKIGQLKVDPDEELLESMQKKQNGKRCGSGTENWLCLHCGVVRCGRYVQGHGLLHWQETRAGENTTETPLSETSHTVAPTTAEGPTTEVIAAVACLTGEPDENRADESLSGSRPQSDDAVPSKVIQTDSTTETSAVTSVGPTPSSEVGDGHCLAVSLSDLSIWCHMCQSYVHGHSYFEMIRQQLEYYKFQPVAAPDDESNQPSQGRLRGHLDDRAPAA